MRTRSWLLAVLFTACGDAPPEAATPLAQRTVQKDAVKQEVVSRVSGQAITLADVQELVNATGLTPQAALTRLQEERLLAAYAEAQGYGGHGLVVREERRALVRSLLRSAVDKGRGPAEISAAEVAARFAEVRARYEKPARRAVVHLLFAGPRGGDLDAAAKARANKELARLSALTPEAALEQLRARPAKAEESGLELIREAIPEVAIGGALDDAFESAVFSTAGPGLVPAFVKSARGYHIVYVEKLLAPVTLRLIEHEEALREQLSREARKTAFDALVTELSHKTAVTRDEAQAKALDDDKILGLAP